MFQFDSRVVGGESPVNAFLRGVALLLPGAALAAQCRQTGNSPVQALPGKNAQLAFGDVEPGTVFGRIVNFQTLDETARHIGRISLVKRGDLVRVQVVAHEDDLFGLRVISLQELAHLSRPVDGGPALSGAHAPPAAKRLGEHEYAGDSFAPVFVIFSRRTPRSGGERSALLREHLYGLLVHVHNRETGVIRPAING